MPRKQPDNPDQQLLRVWTGALDGLLRVHSWNPITGTLQHLHGVNLDLPGITALTASMHRIAIGTVDGRVLVRERISSSALTARKRTRDPPAGTYAFFQRGMNTNPVSGDYVVQDQHDGKRRKSLKKYDVALRQFRYGDALDEALATRDPKIVVNVLEELGRRRGLAIALSNRDEESLEPVLAFVAKCIVRPRFSPILIGVAEKLLDIYSPVAGQSEVIDELFTKLKEQVSHECTVHQSLLCLQGQVETILAAVEDELYYGS
jgi:U3 small nucleolar RNA-associated protein 15